MGFSKFLAVAATTVSGNPEPAIGVVVATGLIIVFGVLVLLYLIITLEGIVFSSIDKKKNGTPAPAKTPEPAPAAPAKAAPAAPKKAPGVEAGIPAEVVAVIAAAVAAMDGGSGYALRSVRRAKPSGRSAWGQAGVSAYTEPF